MNGQVAPASGSSVFLTPNGYYSDYVDVLLQPTLLASPRRSSITITVSTTGPESTGPIACSTFKYRLPSSPIMLDASLSTGDSTNGGVVQSNWILTLQPSVSLNLLASYTSSPVTLVSGLAKFNTIVMNSYNTSRSQQFSLSGSPAPAWTLSIQRESGVSWNGILIAVSATTSKQYELISSASIANMGTPVPGTSFFCIDAPAATGIADPNECDLGKIPTNIIAAAKQLSVGARLIFNEYNPTG